MDVELILVVFSSERTERTQDKQKYKRLICPTRLVFISTSSDKPNNHMQKTCDNPYFE